MVTRKVSGWWVWILQVRIEPGSKRVRPVDWIGSLIRRDGAREGVKGSIAEIIGLRIGTGRHLRHVRNAICIMRYLSCQLW